MNRGLIIGLAVAGLLFAVLAWVFSEIEWVEQEIALGPTEEARRKPYLAAERFLQRQGLRVESELGLARLDGRNGQERPGTDDVVVLIDAYGMITEPRLQPLLDWVEQGGRLIVSAKNPFVSGHTLEDALFDYFEVGSEPGLASDENEEPEPQTFQDLLESVSACSTLISPIAFNFEDDEHEIQVGFPGWHTLTLPEESDVSWLEDASGVRMGQFNWGDGLITFLAGTELWSNRYIACHDNAYMLLQLTDGGEAVWFLTNQDSPSLWELLWNRAWLWVIAFGLFVVLFLWRQGVRFGPVIPAEDIRRRRLLEHIDAATSFLWRQRQGAEILTQVRTDVEERLARRLPGYRRWPQDKQLAEIARMTGVPEGQIGFAMSTTADSQPDFTRCIQTLQQIKDKL